MHHIKFNLLIGQKIKMDIQTLELIPYSMLKKRPKGQVRPYVAKLIP